MWVVVFIACCVGYLSSTSIPQWAIMDHLQSGNSNTNQAQTR